MPTLTKIYSMEEASQHNTQDDCWVVIDGKVYDVSSYLDEHPGGDDVLLKVTGKDATEEFEDAGHSKDARELMDKFFIGEVDEPSPPIPELKIISKQSLGPQQGILVRPADCGRLICGGGWLLTTKEKLNCLGSDFHCLI